MASEIKRETVVSIKDAYLRYASEKGSVTALENVNLEIEKGEFICVLGPSGCGKSTLLKIIAGCRPRGCFPDTDIVSMVKYLSKCGIRTENA